MAKIELDNSKCIRCNACVDLCPSLIFRRDTDTVLVENVGSCISCGHCVAICPKDAIDHSNFRAGKVHDLGYRPKVDSSELLNLIRVRRSNRAFTDKEIPQEYIDQIIEAAYRAPTASNMQRVKFLLVKDRNTLDAVIDTTIDHFRGLAKLVDNPIIRPLVARFNPMAIRYLKAFKRMIVEREQGGDPVLRGGKVLLIIYTDGTVRFGTEDSNLSYQNASLMAEALGVSQVYTGFVCDIARKNKKINKILGINGKIEAGMALGMPKRLFTKYIDKRDIDLRVI